MHFSKELCFFFFYFFSPITPLFLLSRQLEGEQLALNSFIHHVVLNLYGNRHVCGPVCGKRYLEECWWSNGLLPLTPNLWMKNISKYLFHKRIEIVHVWNNMRGRKLVNHFYIGEDDHFKSVDSWEQTCWSSMTDLIHLICGGKQTDLIFSHSLLRVRIVIFGGLQCWSSPRLRWLRMCSGWPMAEL